MNLFIKANDFNFNFQGFNDYIKLNFINFTIYALVLRKKKKLLLNIILRSL